MPDPRPLWQRRWEVWDQDALVALPESEGDVRRVVRRLQQEGSLRITVCRRREIVQRRDLEPKGQRHDR